jgi:hypothetical protein
LTQKNDGAFHGISVIVLKLQIAALQSIKGYRAFLHIGAIVTLKECVSDPFAFANTEYQIDAA